ncbi:MAG TPA: helix-turn-helix domain-containing protein [Natrialbaceae archaeon]|nr:helix-turn-helix domain-containing protein [Natrialbaceae archaeon]
MRGFSDEERDEIEAELLETARDLFTKFGYKKTSVKDVTEPVGIAEGTFYRFFDTKSELYARVLLLEQEELVSAVEAEVRAVDAPDEKLERLLRTWAREFEKRPLLRRSHQEPQRLLRNVDPDALETALEDGRRQFAERLLPIVRDVQERSDGYITELDPRFVLELLSAIELTVAQKDLFEEYSWSEFSAFQDTFATILVRGLLGDASPD